MRSTSNTSCVPTIRMPTFCSGDGIFFVKLLRRPETSGVNTGSSFEDFVCFSGFALTVKGAGKPVCRKLWSLVISSFDKLEDRLFRPMPINCIFIDRLYYARTLRRVASPMYRLTLCIVCCDSFKGVSYIVDLHLSSASGLRPLTGIT